MTMAQTRDFARKTNRRTPAVPERESLLRSAARVANQLVSSKQFFESRFGHDFSRIRVPRIPLVGCPGPSPSFELALSTIRWNTKRSV